MVSLSVLHNQLYSFISQFFLLKDKKENINSIKIVKRMIDNIILLKSNLVIIKA